MTAADESVVLLDELGNAVGTAPKATVHHDRTPLHLAFSCYVFDGRGRLLITRRATTKATFPGAWTNSYCGHPSPGEDVLDALARRGRQELGLEVRDLHVVLPAFRYSATMPNGVRENEMCPVFTAVTDDEPRPDVTEVDSVDWVPWRSFRSEVLAGSRQVSPWCEEQVAQLSRRELAGGGFVIGRHEDLPPAMRRG